MWAGMALVTHSQHFCLLGRREVTDPDYSKLAKKNSPCERNFVSFIAITGGPQTLAYRRYSVNIC
jgi:hypothetical protein